MRFFSFLDRKKKLQILDVDDPGHIEKVADEIVFKGGIIAFPVVYDYGLMTVNTNVEGMAKIFMIKKRPLNDTLVIGGSHQTRQEVVDWSRVPEVMKQLGDHIFDLPHFLEMPILEAVHPWVGKTHPQLGRVGVIFWANYYEPIAKLEAAVKRRNPNSFLVGSSANLHGQPAAETAQQVYESFKGAKPYLSYIMRDKKMEYSNQPFHGTHTMVQFRNGKFEIARIGSISAGHFAQVYPQIALEGKHQQKEQQRWQQDLQNGFDIKSIRKKGTYIL